ncbi:MAG: hypothetical protein K0Q58_815, partial [Microbacterium sp.]|nr:hypothetical protein [Microbacterium sp.]
MQAATPSADSVAGSTASEFAPSSGAPVAAGAEVSGVAAGAETDGLEPVVGAALPRQGCATNSQTRATMRSRPTTSTSRR